MTGAAPPVGGDAARPAVRPLRSIVLLGLAVRLAHLAFVAHTPFLDLHHTFAESDMAMFDGWARRIAAGDVLGRETYHPLYQWQLDAAPAESWTRWYGAAPTFYKAPFYPYLMALAYATLGDPVLVVAILQILASTIGIVLLHRVTARLFGETAAGLAALGFALYGPAIHYDVILLRGPWIVLTALLVTWRLLELRDRPGRRAALLLGLAMGAGLVVNEGFATLIPLVALVTLLWLPDPRRWLEPLAAMGAGMGLVLAPVVARNVVVGAPPLALAVTGSTVYTIFNAAGDSPYFFEIHPRVFLPILERTGGAMLATAVACLRSFGSVGAVAAFYWRKSLGLVVPYENADNANYYYACLRSPVLAVLPAYGVLFPLAAVGLGLALRRARDLLALAPVIASVVAALLLTLPLSRYRVVLAVFLLPLAGLACARAAEWVERRAWRPLAAAALGGVLSAAVVAGLQHRVLFGGEPAGRFLYRPPEFWLAFSAYSGRGLWVEARREVSELAGLNSDPAIRASALLLVGRAEVKLGRPDRARSAVSAATLVGPRDPGLLLAAGDFYANELADQTAAASMWRQALALDPPDALRTEIERRLVAPSPAAKR